MNPFTSYRLAAIQNKTDHMNNSLLSLDVYYNIGKRCTVFGQFLFDDMLRSKEIQDRWAFDAGANFRDLFGLGRTTAGVRTTIVSSFAYNTFQPFERYLLNGRPLGAPLGNDYWRLFGYLRYFFSSRLDLKVQFELVERGCQRVSAPCLALLHSAEMEFPTPPVERRMKTGLSLRWQLLEQAHLQGEGGFFKEKNMNNHPGTKRGRGYVLFYLSLYRDLLLRF